MANISHENPRQSLLKKLGRKFRKLLGKKPPNEISGTSRTQEASTLDTRETEMERRLKMLIRSISSESPRISPGETSAALIERVEIFYLTLNPDEQAAVRHTFFEILKRVDLTIREWLQCISFLGKKKEHFSDEEMETLILEIKSMKKRKKQRKDIANYIKRVKNARKIKREKREKNQAKETRM